MTPAFGRVIRWTVVLGWVAFFAVHAARHALPGLGLVERHDMAAVLAAQLDRTLVYQVLDAGGGAGAGKLQGSCQLAFHRDDNFFRLDFGLVLDDFPGAALIRSKLGGGARGSARALSVQITQRLDDRYRLTALEASGSVFGLAGRLKGVVDARGFHGAYETMDGDSEDLEVPGIAQDDMNGLALALSLPPNLVPGDRFTTKVLPIEDWMSRQPRQRTAVFVAEAVETITTRAGDCPALRVRMSLDDRIYATLWCDAHGTVYRSRLADFPMAMELKFIRAIGERGQEVIWPPPPPSSTVAPPAVSEARP